MAHAALSSFGEPVESGADGLVTAMTRLFPVLVMPAFTDHPMIIPEAGPAGNGLEYGSGQNTNRLARAYTPTMPIDRMIGAVPEALRLRSQAKRSTHPLLSFCGLGADPYLAGQSLQEPLAPIRLMAGDGGYVLLIGVDHTCNTSIHYGELLAGRKQFVRWALTHEGIVACPGYPGCSDGFDTIRPELAVVTRQVTIGKSLIQAVPMVELIERVRAYLFHDPFGLLCARSDCERCNAVRDALEDTSRRTIPNY
jgi:aminoglycoside 3-N-acetyltransferase